jgi:hypothetical protein
METTAPVTQPSPTAPTAGTVNASDVIAALTGERDVPPPPANLIDPTTKPTSGLMDQQGNAWNAITDASPARMNAKGLWCKKGGNGARKAKGQAFVVPTAANGQRPTVSDQLNGQPITDAMGQAIETTAQPMAQTVAPVALTIDHYKATGEGIRRGLFALLQMIFGAAWKPDAEEQARWDESLTRLWAHYQWPRLGPIPEVLINAGETIRKRLDDVKTLGVWKSCMIWLGLKKREPVPVDSAH